MSSRLTWSTDLSSRAAKLHIEILSQNKNPRLPATHIPKTHHFAFPSMVHYGDYVITKWKSWFSDSDKKKNRLGVGKVFISILSFGHLFCFPSHTYQKAEL